MLTGLCLDIPRFGNIQAFASPLPASMPPAALVQIPVRHNTRKYRENTALKTN